MYALPAAPPPAPRRQLFVGTALACAAGTTLFGGLIALYLRFRQDALSVAGAEWKPAGIKVPDVPTNVMLIAFLFIGIFAQWAVYSARREQRTNTSLALGLVALLGLAVINSQAFVYRQMGAALRDGTYQTMFYALTGTFVALMIVGLVFTAVAALRYLGGRTSEREIISAHAMYWYFLSAMYVALWFVVYITK